MLYSMLPLEVACAGDIPTRKIWVDAPDENNIKLSFIFDSLPNVAVFQRGKMLWIVFDQVFKLDLFHTKKFKNELIGRPHVIEHPEATIIRLELKESHIPAILRGKNTFSLQFSAFAQNHPHILPLDEGINDNGTLIFGFPNKTKPIVIKDPDANDYLYVFPLQQEGIEIERQFTDFTIIESLQGLVLNTGDDILNINIQNEKLSISGKNRALILSKNEDRKRQRNQAIVPALFPFLSELPPIPEKDWIYHRQFLLRKIHESSDPLKARHNLINFFINTHNIEEALGVAKLIKAESPLRAMLLALCKKIRLSRTLLDDMDLMSEPEMMLWLAYAESAQGFYKSAFEKFTQSLAYFQNYPTKIKNTLALMAAHSSLEVGYSAQIFLNLINQKELSRDQIVHHKYLLARELLLNDDKENAIAYLKNVQESHDNRKIKTLAILSLGTLDPEKNPDDFLKVLENLETEWRYDSIEVEVLERLIHLYLEKKEDVAVIKSVRTLSEYYPDFYNLEIYREQARNCFLNKTEQLLKESPIDAVAFFSTYRQFAGFEPRSIEVTHKIIDVMLDMKVYTKAEELLKLQLQNTEPKEPLYYILTIELANVLSEEEKDDEALKTLKAISSNDMNDDLKKRKAFLEAKILIELEKFDEARALMKSMNSNQIQLLQIQLAWQQKEWEELKKLLDEFLTTPPDNQPLNPRMILQYATSLANLGKTEDLKGLEEKYGSMMEKSHYKNEFQMLIHPLKPLAS